MPQTPGMQKVIVYFPICNFPKDVLGFENGKVLDDDAADDFLWTWYSHAAPSNHSLKAPINHGWDSDLQVILENVDQFVKPIHRRQMGMHLLDTWQPQHGNILIAHSMKWLASSPRDFALILNKLKEGNESSLHFVCEEHDAYTIEYPQITLQEASSMLEEIERSMAFHRSIRRKIGNYKSKLRRSHVGGSVPMGFTLGSQGVLIPDWESQKLIRLIAFLRDHAKLTWPKVRDRLVELYEKPGRRYPAVSKAKIPWSYPQCYKGYKAWKRISNGEI